MKNTKWKKNIHANINDRDIFDFINDEHYNRQKFEKWTLKKLQDNKNKKEIYFPKKLLVFLDRNNTCKSMLICELIQKYISKERFDR